MWYYFLLLFLFTSLTLGAQSVQRLRAEGMFGFIIKHASDLKPFAGTYPYTLQLGWQTMPTTQNSWDACNCFHYLGIEFSYVNFNNREVLGEAYILSGSFEPVLWRKGRVSLSLHTGIGAAWITKVYDPATNPLNRFFSNHLSFLLFLAPILEYRFANDWSMSLGYYYNHISNGGQKQPNRGMNFPQTAIGLSYFLQQSELPEYPKILPERKFHFWVEGAFTTRSTGIGQQRKPYFSAVIGAYRPLSVINALGIGIENSLDLSVIDKNKSKYTIAPFISHHFLLGKFDFSQRMGYYLVRPGDVSSFRFYQRYVLYFNPFGNILIGSSLKAHGHRAQNMDLRIAWRF